MGAVVAAADTAASAINGMAGAASVIDYTCLLSRKAVPTHSRDRLFSFPQGSITFKGIDTAPLKSQFLLNTYGR